MVTCTEYEPQPIVVDILCPNGHKEEYQFRDPWVDVHWARCFAALLEGRIKLDTVPADLKERIGKCIQCGAGFKATIRGDKRGGP